MAFEKLNRAVFKKARPITYLAALILLAASAFLSLNSGGIGFLGLANRAGWLSFSFISLALLVTPLRAVLPKFSLNPSLVYARRAFGVSGCGFALLHFVLQSVFLFGFGLGPLERTWAGTIAMAIIFVLGITSTDYAVRKLGRNWFRLQRLVYLAYPLILIHAIGIGIDFGRADAYSVSFLVIAAVTLAFEAARIAKRLARKPNEPKAVEPQKAPEAQEKTEPESQAPSLTPKT
jgi:sulfoxide reductase heme-binding subunit YedZ